MHHGWLVWLDGQFDSLGSAISGGVIGGAGDALKEKFEEWTGHDNVQDYLDELLDDFLPDASTYEQAREKLDELLENFKEFGEEVVAEIGDVIEDILDTGEIPETTDGGLGETHDIFTPESDVPNPPAGEIPGIGGPGTGMDRDVTAPSGGGGSGGGSGGTSPPLGGAEAEPPPAAAEPSQPTFDDLGLDPDSGAYYEYQPGNGQVVITYPDGSTEVRTWP